MRNAVLISLILLLATAGCITVDMGGGGSKAPQVVKFTVSPSTINPGEASILSWEVDGASLVIIDPGIPSAPSAGAEKVMPTTTTTYILTASNKYGTTRSTVLLTVAAGGVTPPPAALAPVINSFTASPSSISAGNTAVLTWSTTNATGARINGADVAVNGSQTVNPASTTTYLLEATNGSLSTSYSTMIVVTSPVTPPPSTGLPTILSFTASPSSVAAGGSTTLNWSTLNATSASIAGFGTVPVSGSLPINTTGTGSITFYLTATNAAGTSNASTTVTVGSIYTPPTPTGSPPIAALYISPSSITSGGSATLSWVTSGATSLSINNGVKSLVGVTGATGSLTVTPTSTTTYTLTASNSYGNTYSSQTLTVTALVPYIPPAWPVISDFHCSHTTVTAGNQAKLYWTVSDADNIYIDNGIGSVGPSGTVYIYPTYTTTYTLTASNGANTTARSVVVNVTP